MFGRGQIAAPPSPMRTISIVTVLGGVGWRLSAGGRWLRTIGIRKINYRFETDFCHLRDGFGSGSRTGFIFFATGNQIVRLPLSLQQRVGRRIGTPCETQSSKPKTKWATIRLTAPAYWKFESIPLQRRVHVSR